jgi:hypothetical protein
VRAFETGQGMEMAAEHRLAIEHWQDKGDPPMPEREKMLRGQCGCSRGISIDAHELRGPPRTAKGHKGKVLFAQRVDARIGKLGAKQQRAVDMLGPDELEDACRVESMRDFTHQGVAVVRQPVRHPRDEVKGRTLGEGAVRGIKRHGEADALGTARGQTQGIGIGVVIELANSREDGFMPYAGTTPSFPHSMEFFYMPVRSVMQGPHTFTWRPLDTQLSQIARRGYQAVFRFYLDYPTEPSGVPDYLLKEGLTVHPYTDYGNATSVSPDYDDPRLRTAMVTFITALAHRYDGDPRIAFIEVGLIGFWGEWHTYPHDEWIASLTTMDLVLQTYTAAFHHTKLLVRLPIDPIHIYRVGYHDDSFAYDTVANGNGNFMDTLDQLNLQDTWQTQPIGGELRPELQSCIWHDPSCARPPQDYTSAVDATHASWLLNQGVFDHRLPVADYARALAGARRLGYELSVTAVALPHTNAPGAPAVRLQLRNTGRAPFYYNWPLELGLIDGRHLLRRWDTGWRLTQALPGAQVTFAFTLPYLCLPPGAYTLVLRAVNPLTSGKPLRFADSAQDETLPGWLTLGTLIWRG